MNALKSLKCRVRTKHSIMLGIITTGSVMSGIHACNSQSCLHQLANCVAALESTWYRRRYTAIKHYTTHSTVQHLQGLAVPLVVLEYAQQVCSALYFRQYHRYSYESSQDVSLQTISTRHTISSLTLTLYCEHVRTSVGDLQKAVCGHESHSKMVCS